MAGVDMLLNNMGLLTAEGEVPPETPNGNITEFSMLHIPWNEAKIKVYHNGALMRYGSSNDYTVVKSGITRRVKFASAPASNAVIQFHYDYMP